MWSVNSPEAQNDATQHDAEFNKYNPKVDLRQKPRPRDLMWTATHGLSPFSEYDHMRQASPRVWSQGPGKSDFERKALQDVYAWIVAQKCTMQF